MTESQQEELIRKYNLLVSVAHNMADILSEHLDGEPEKPAMISTALSFTPIEYKASPAIPDGMMVLPIAWQSIINEVDRRAGKMDGTTSDFEVTISSEDYNATL